MISVINLLEHEVVSYLMSLGDETLLNKNPQLILEELYPAKNTFVFKVTQEDCDTNVYFYYHRNNEIEMSHNVTCNCDSEKVYCNHVNLVFSQIWQNINNYKHL